MSNEKVEMIVDLVYELNEARGEASHARSMLATEQVRTKSVEAELKKSLENTDSARKELYECRAKKDEYSIQLEQVERSLETNNNYALVNQREIDRMTKEDADRLAGVIAMKDDEFENYMQLWRLSLETQREEYKKKRAKDFKTLIEGIKSGAVNPFPIYASCDFAQAAGGDDTVINVFSGGPKAWIQAAQNIGKNAKINELLHEHMIAGHNIVDFRPGIREPKPEPIPVIKARSDHQVVRIQVGENDADFQDFIVSDVQVESSFSNDGCDFMGRHMMPRAGAKITLSARRK